MNKIIVLFLLVSASMFSQETITRDLGTFTELKVFSGLNVTIKKSEKSFIEISGKKSDDVLVKNTNGRLKLSMRLAGRFSADDVKIILYYKNNLTEIDTNQGSYVGSDEVIKQPKIELKTQEGGIIDLDLELDFLTIRCVTGGYVIASGVSKNQEVETFSGAMYKGYSLKSENTSVVSSTGGIAKITVSEFLDAKVRLGGTVFYKGNPKKVNSNKIIGGTIKSKDE